MPLDPRSTSPSVVVCVNDRMSPTRPSCAARGIRLADRLQEELATWDPPIPVERVHCLGECAKGPNLRLAPGGRFFHRAALEAIPEILAALSEQIQTGNALAPPAAEAEKIIDPIDTGGPKRP